MDLEGFSWISEIGQEVLNSDEGGPHALLSKTKRFSEKFRQVGTPPEVLLLWSNPIQTSPTCLTSILSEYDG